MMIKVYVINIIVMGIYLLLKIEKQKKKKLKYKMVILNEYLPINISSLKRHITNKIKEILEDRMEYLIKTNSILNKDIKNILFDNIIKDIKNSITSDYFLYLVMDDNYCTHKYRRGRNENKYCAKKIRSNNPKKVYLCCKHDPDHIPVPKNQKNPNITEVVENNNVNLNIKNDINKDRIFSKKNMLNRYKYKYKRKKVKYNKCKIINNNKDLTFFNNYSKLYKILLLYNKYKDKIEIKNYDYPF